MNTFIYCLIDPRNGTVRYVGKSNNPDRRLSEHLKEKGVNKKLNWLKSLRKNNLKPEVLILDEVEQISWQFWEQHYISLYKSWGFNLTNGSGGGEGPSEIIAMRIAQKLRGRKSPEGARDKAIATRQKRFKETGKWAKDGTYQKVAKTLKGQTRSKEVCDQMSVSAKLAFKEGRRKVQGGAGISRPGKLNAVSRGVVQYDLQGSFVKEWESAKQAGESFGVTNSGIIGVCKGKKLTCKNFIWRYKSPLIDEPQNILESIQETIFKIAEAKELVRQNMRKQQLLKWN